MVIAMLDDLGIDKFSFADNSLGGVIGVKIAAMGPKRLTRLALFSVNLSASMVREGLRKLDASVDPAEWTRDWRLRPRTLAQAAKFGTIDPQIEVEQNASRARADRWVRPSERGVDLADTAAKLARIQAPTLLIHADRGHYLKYEVTGRAQIQTEQVAHVAGSGSFVHQERPAETGRILREFFTG